MNNVRKVGQTGVLRPTNTLLVRVRMLGYGLGGGARRPELHHVYQYPFEAVPVPQLGCIHGNCSFYPTYCITPGARFTQRIAVPREMSNYVVSL